MKGIIVAGIGTDVGKTIASAALCEALGADYWKPIQSGTDDAPADATTVSSLIANGQARVHPSTYSFRRSLSPHAAARCEEVEISLESLRAPEISRPLVVELAGGVLVPMNDRHTNLDLIKKLGLPVVVVSRHYLGSINHTLLTCEVLKAHEVAIQGILFNGDETLPDSERVIERMSGVPVIGRIPTLASVTPPEIATVAALLALR
jgi:dethiobiotin synthetase